MKNIIFRVTLISVVILVIFLLVWRFWPKTSSQSLLDIGSKKSQEEPGKENISSSEPLSVSGWIPYWKKTEGSEFLSKNLDLFSEINPFAFDIDESGRVTDPLKIKSAPWPELFSLAKEKNVDVIPTFLWTNDQAMHEIFSNPTKRAQHVEALIETLDGNGFSGVDIDYEGKDRADKDLFSQFLKELSQNLHASGKTLECTIESRNEDAPPSDWTGVQAMAFANDLGVLGQICDQVKIMAYDQVFQVNGMKRSFEILGDNSVAPNADIYWVESVLRYALRFIAPDKLVMGVPTYGWEFSFEKTAGGYRYTKVESVDYPEALEKSQKSGATVERTDGGEPYFVYPVSGEEHIVTFSDAEAVRQKISLAKKLGIKGIVFFKLDGLWDPEISSVLSESEND